MSSDYRSIEVDYDPFASENELSRVISSTEAQREIWSSIQMTDDASCAFNESISLHFIGNLNISALTSSISYLIQRHEALRATFTSDGASLCMANSLSIDVPIIEGDLNTISDLKIKEVETPFDLEKGPLIRCLIAKISDDEFHFILTAHHIICDGWSLAIMINDLGVAYSAYLNEQKPEQESAFTFDEFITQNRKELESNNDETYWMSLFGQYIPYYELPIDKQRPSFRTFNSQRLDYSIDIDLIADIKNLASANACSLTAIMLAAYYLCLQRWSGEDTLVVGIPAASQPSYAPETLVGHCVNMLPILITVDASKSFVDLMRDVSECVLTSYEHQNYTYGTLLKKLPVNRDPSRIPLVPTLFNVDQGVQGSQLNFQGLTVDFQSNPRHFENFEIFINASDYGEKFIIECQYNTDLFSAESIEKRLHEYVQVLKNIRTNVNIKLCDIHLLTAEERAANIEQHQTIKIWDNINGSGKDHIHSLISTQAKTKPDAIAAYCGGEQITYSQLDEKSNQLAHYLIQQGVLPGTLTGLCLDRSVDMLIALLGILKAGGGYVPLDPEYPAERLSYMVEDAGLEYLITQAAYAQQFSDVNNVTKIESLNDSLSNFSVSDPDVDIGTDNTAYVIYTSGSTGKPKGVMVQHEAVVNFLNSMAEKPGLNENDCILAVTTLSFDIAVLEIYLPLVVGAQLVIAQKEEAIDGNKLLSLINQYKITVMQATPATWRMLISSGWKGNNNFKILCGGEALARDLASDLLEISSELWNMYGPTETTVWSTCQKISDTKQAPGIGEPVANTELYILDEQLEPVPQGIAGELYIGGHGVTKGYLNREVLTAERFIHNSFTDKGRIYRTGDKVRYRLDGSLEYMGRLDSQVKLRGYRIELGEIETLMRQHKNIDDCALAIKEQRAGDTRLVAYVVWNNIISLSELRQYLLEWIPVYMVPQHIVNLEELPRTPNGKLDRKALPDPVFNESEKRRFIEPKTETEASLLAIWKDVLGIPSISTDENFFDLGGHSLLIAQIIQKFEIDKSILLQYRDVFNYPTIKELASKIDNMSKTDMQLYEKITPRSSDQKNVLSLAQQRLWYLDKMSPNSTHFNLPAAFRYLGNLDIKALNQAFREMMTRHEILRTGIIEEDEMPVQRIHDKFEFKLNEIDLTNLPKDQREGSLHKKLDELQLSVFDIAKAPLFISALIKLSDEEHVLFFMPHHLIFDGWSFDVFTHEITTLYAKHTGANFQPLAELPIQYADYAIWLRDLLSGTELDKQLEFWKRLLQGTLPVLDIPLDYPRPNIAENHGDEVHFEIDEGLVDSLLQLANKQEASLFMVMLSAYASILYRYTGQTDLIIGAPMADRTRPGIENLIGFFVNALVLRFNINPDNSFVELLKQVKELCLSGYANQDVPFEQLVELLNPDRDLSRAPLFQTSITYQDVSSRETEMGDINIKQVEIPTHEAPLDINIWFKRRGPHILGAVVYNVDLFERETIEKFVSHYISLLKSIVTSWHQTIRHLPVLTNDERIYQLKLHNTTDMIWSGKQQIHELISRQAEKTPDTIAVCFDDKQITYSELQNLSNQFANYLISKGIKNNVMVGLCVDRSIEMLIALLGVLKTGSAYVPLDPEYPEARLSYMIEDANLGFLITQDKYVKKLPDVKSTILIDDLKSLLVDYSITSPDLRINDDAIAYVIYTSGSTGKPKGVMVHHAAAANFLNSMEKSPGLNKDDILLAVTTLSFDIAVLELYLPLVTGGQLIIANREEAIDGRRLLSLIKKHKVTAMQATPATWRMLIGSGWTTENKLKVLCGGEAMPIDLAANLIERSTELWNMYGPTETTVWSTCHKITDAKQPLSIGKPIANTRLYILDESMQPVPQGVAGELYIGGSGVSKGYLNQNELTAERFVDDSITGQGKLYRTGDKVRYRSDDSLEYMGRLDSQVKVRGYRIELGEIESIMRQHEQIVDCAIAVNEERAGDARLVAYVVWKNSALTMTELRQYLRDWIPVYMVPQHIMDMTELPRTPNGKLDRNNLPDMFASVSSSSNYVEPRSEEECWLSDTWKEIIGIDKVGLYDNFFELGGHSLLSMQVIHKITEKTNITLNPRDLLLDTLEQIAEKITVHKSNAAIQEKAGELVDNQEDNAEKKGIKKLFNRMFK